MISTTFRARIIRGGSMCFIQLTFDPKPVFGKMRVLVKVMLNGYTYSSTIAAMGGLPCVPLSKSNREAAGLQGGEMVTIRLDLDTDKREMKPPADLLRALRPIPGGSDRWRALSYTHQREHVEAINNARKQETRDRRIAAAVKMIQPTADKRNA